MSLAVLGRPSLRPADRAWIESLRSRHRGSLFGDGLGPHLTLVFPCDVTDPTTATSHLATVAGETAPFDLAFRSTLPAPDGLGSETFVYLVPDEGFSAIVRLHDRLYSGPFAEALRLDVGYLPHITLGRFCEAKLAKALADDLNNQDPEIRGRLETIELYRIAAGAPPHRLAEVALRG